MSLRIKDGENEIEILFDHINEKTDLNEEVRASRISSLYPLPPNTKGTLVTMKCNGQLPITAVSLCSPKDNFSKSTGRKLALSRAIKIAKERKIIDKKISKIIWNEYRKNCK
jgi:hypothetical protein